METKKINLKVVLFFILFLQNCSSMAIVGTGLQIIKTAIEINKLTKEQPTVIMQQQSCENKTGDTYIKNITIENQKDSLFIKNYLNKINIDHKRIHSK